MLQQFHPLFGGEVDVPSYIAFQETPLQTFWPFVIIVRASRACCPHPISAACVVLIALDVRGTYGVRSQLRSSRFSRSSPSTRTRRHPRAHCQGARSSQHAPPRACADALLDRISRRCRPFGGGEMWSIRSDFESGNFGFDPLGLRPESAEEYKEMCAAPSRLSFL